LQTEERCATVSCGCHWSGALLGGYLEANADYTADLATMIVNFVDYGKTRQRIERLGSKLEIPAAR
jgi:hypothetical protein